MAAPVAGFEPTSPAGSGYALVFDDEFASPASIDIDDTGKPGFKWYVKPFFGGVTAPAAISVANGVLSLHPVRDSPAALSTAAPGRSSKAWVGQVFGRGGYFEARLKFDPSSVELSRGHPAFWAASLEHARGNAQWPGQPPGYERFTEDDFFEYDAAPIAGPNSYAGAMHDWHGNWRQTCPRGYCDIFTPADLLVIRTPPGTDFRQFHTFGQLWVPATPTNRGYVQYYFDGRPTADRVSWRYQFEPGTPPPSGDSLFGILDRQHLVVILGTGADQPIAVDWVRIWQLPGRGERLIGRGG